MIGKFSPVQAAGLGVKAWDYILLALILLFRIPMSVEGDNLEELAWPASWNSENQNIVPDLVVAMKSAI